MRGFSVLSVFATLLLIVASWGAVQLLRFHFEHRDLEERVGEILSQGLSSARHDIAQEIVDYLSTQGIRVELEAIEITLSEDRQKAWLKATYHRRIHVGFAGFSKAYAFDLERAAPRPAGKMGQSIQDRLGQSAQEAEGRAAPEVE